ncbi:MAG: ABC transporter ATP-binding protein [Candidatus Schekmanbacteria bacterium]|nr:ABC transporter ATP-binding protein [Candidatus Schekmanbacteria bacterium]
MDEVLKIEGIDFSYGNGNVLYNVNLSVNEGEMLAILGPNGCGKTTLLRLIYGALKASRGRITLFGKEHLSRKEVSEKVAIVSKSENTSISFLVSEMVMMGRYVKSKGIWFENNEDKKMIAGILDELHIEHLSAKYFNCLSSGEQQRVLIGRALAQKPELMLLDEPTSHLDISHQLECHSLLKKLNDSSGMTMVIISHDLNLAAQFCSRIILMKDGRVFADGHAGDVLTEQNIREVYGIDTIVDGNPVTGTPRVTLLS